MVLLEAALVGKRVSASLLWAAPEGSASATGDAFPSFTTGGSEFLE